MGTLTPPPIPVHAQKRESEVDRRGVLAAVRPAMRPRSGKPGTSRRSQPETPPRTARCATCTPDEQDSVQGIVNANAWDSVVPGARCHKPLIMRRAAVDVQGHYLTLASDLHFGAETQR